MKKFLYISSGIALTGIVIAGIYFLSKEFVMQDEIKEEKEIDIKARLEEAKKRINERVLEYNTRVNNA